MTTPRVSLVAYDDRQGNFIFVAVPDQRGRYLRTDRSVALVDCHQCGAMQGEPCFSGTPREQRYGGTTHYVRRKRSMYLHGYGAPADDLLCPSELPPNVPDEWMEASA